jgi:hypothetical protein
MKWLIKNNIIILHKHIGIAVTKDIKLMGSVLINLIKLLTLFKMTVYDFLKKWDKENGSSDPRLMLDKFFYSYLFINDRRSLKDYHEREEWCGNNLGNENWHREFNKFWFTSESDLIMFKLAWLEDDKREIT